MIHESAEKSYKRFSVNLDTISLDILFSPFWGDGLESYLGRSKGLCQQGKKFVLHELNTWKLGLFTTFEAERLIPFFFALPSLVSFLRTKLRKSTWISTWNLALFCVKIFNMYRFISKRFTNQELIWQLTDNMQSGGSCSVCKRRKLTSLLQIIYHWSNLVLDVSYSISPFHNCGLLIYYLIWVKITKEFLLLKEAREAHFSSDYCLSLLKLVLKLEPF